MMDEKSVQRLFLTFPLGLTFNNCLVSTDLSEYARFCSHNFYKTEDQIRTAQAFSYPNHFISLLQ